MGACSPLRFHGCHTLFASPSPLDQVSLDLIDHPHAGRHGVGQPKRLPDVALALADERPDQRADVEDRRGPVGLVAREPGGAVEHPGQGPACSAHRPPPPGES